MATSLAVLKSPLNNPKINPDWGLVVALSPCFRKNKG